MSAPDKLDPNESTCDLEDFALNLLEDGADAARALVSNLPKANADALSRHSVVAVGHALLVHLDALADQQYQQGQELIGELKVLSDSVKFLAGRLDSVHPRAKPSPASKQAPSDYSRLEELLGFAQSAFSDADYREALTRLRRLAGV
jgi:hypothetical protein